MVKAADPCCAEIPPRRDKKGEQIWRSKPLPLRILTVCAGADDEQELSGYLFTPGILDFGLKGRADQFDVGCQHELVESEVLVACNVSSPHGVHDHGHAGGMAGGDDTFKCIGEPCVALVEAKTKAEVNRANVKPCNPLHPGDVRNVLKTAAILDHRIDMGPNIRR